MEISIVIVIAALVVAALGYFVLSESKEETLDKPIVTPNVDSKKETKAAAKKSSTTAPKTKSKKKTAVNFDAMTKTQLLEHAKKNNIKVNASMKKAEIVSKIKTG